MAHDIRTPLNAVMGFADIAKRSLGDPSKITDFTGAKPGRPGLI
ncbi:MAG: histidine kinase dimerization/phospho-acceptor domain-containing protein [Coprococcus sp.]